MISRALKTVIKVLRFWALVTSLVSFSVEIHSKTSKQQGRFQRREGEVSWGLL